MVLIFMTQKSHIIIHVISKQRKNALIAILHLQVTIRPLSQRKNSHLTFYLVCWTKLSTFAQIKYQILDKQLKLRFF